MQHLLATRRKVSPIAMGRTPPSFLASACSGALDMTSMTAGGKRPPTIRLMRRVSCSSRAASSCGVPVLCSKSLRCCGSTPKQPPAEPALKELIAASTSASVKRKGSGLAAAAAPCCGCCGGPSSGNFALSAFRVSSDAGAKPCDRRARRASDSRPSDARKSALAAFASRCVACRCALAAAAE